MRRFFSLLLAAVMLLSLCACGGTGEGPGSSSPVSEGSEGPSAPEAEPGPEAEEAVLTPAPGVEVRTLLTWEPGSRRVEIPFPVRDERLLVETHTQTGQWIETGLAGFDLTTGEEFAIPLAKFDGFEYRQVLDAPGWEIKIFSKTSYQRLSWTQSLDDYTLPESLWEGRRTYSGSFDWDARPEKDLLTWTSPEGLWLAAADGSGARVVLAVGEVAKQPDFAFLEGEAALAFQRPRLMNGGRTVVVDFDLPGSPTGHIGLAVLEIATGKAFWYAPFANPLWGRLEYLDDTTVQAGFLQIDVVTGEAKEVSRHIQVGDPYFVATTGDFSRYFACTAEEGLAVFPSAGREPETALTAAGYRKLSLCHAIDGRRVVCEYEKPGEAGLLLVNVPEPPPPEPVPDPVLTVSPGVECKTLLTWDGAEKEITMGPRCLENKQLLLETAGDKRSILGLDLETGAIDFTLPLEENSYLREVLGEPGEFLVMGRTGCRHYVWREDGWLGEYPAYDLPEQARKAMEHYDFQKCHFLWDYLPRENLLAWTQGDGIWLSALDGSDARLAIPAKEIFDRPEFDHITQEEYYQKYFELPDPNTDTGPLLVEPRLMADGKVLVTSAYFLSMLSDDFCHDYGLEILDISTGERNWYKREHPLVGSFRLLDQTSLVMEYDKIDVVHKTKEPLHLEHFYEWPAGRSYSADSLHFFGQTGDEGTTILVRYTWDGQDELCTPDIEYQQGRAQALISLKYAWLHYPTPLDSRRALCIYRSGIYRSDGWSNTTETLLLVTAPD